MAAVNNQDSKTKSAAKRVARAGGWVLVKRLSKSIPFAGTVIAIGLAGQSIRRKGWVKGSIDAGLDAIPIVGTAKTVVEIFTGDLISDKEDKKNGTK